MVLPSTVIVRTPSIGSFRQGVASADNGNIGE